jgi:hypothetical protein
MRTQCGHQQRPGDICSDVPELERLCYFFGQLLEPADLRVEQAYFVNRLALLTRYSIGWGVACGLDVDVSIGPPDGRDDEPEIERLFLVVEPGVAVDCCGELLILRKRYCRRLWDLLDDAGRRALREGKPLYVAVEHLARPVRPSRPSDYGACDPLTELQYGRIRDEVRVRVRLTPPAEPSCDTCLVPCDDDAVLLAGFRWNPKRRTVGTQVDVRRPLGRHRLATITGLGWVHNGTYSRRAAEAVLEEGVGLRFSRPVRAATLSDGVVDLVVYEGGGGRREAWYFKEVELSAEPDSGGLCREIRVRAAQPEGFQVGDRILLAVRCGFVLDECCRAVSGEHLGGGVPFDPRLSKVDGHPKPAELACASPPDRRGRWRSGNGVEGGTFESWIRVGRDNEPRPGQMPAFDLHARPARRQAPGE